MMIASKLCRIPISTVDIKLMDYFFHPMKGYVKISTDEAVCSMDDDDDGDDKIANIGTNTDEMDVSTENTKHDESMYLCAVYQTVPIHNIINEVIKFLID